MLIIDLQVNFRSINRIGIHNVYPKNMSYDFQGECTYDVYNFGDLLIDTKRTKPIGTVKHKRSAGAEALAVKALKLVVKHGKQSTK